MSIGVIVALVIEIYLTFSTGRLYDTHVELERKIADGQATLERLNSKTWGIRLVEGSEGKFIYMPLNWIDTDGRRRQWTYTDTGSGRIGIAIKVD